MLFDTFLGVLATRDLPWSMCVSISQTWHFLWLVPHTPDIQFFTEWQPMMHLTAPPPLLGISIPKIKPGGGEKCIGAWPGGIPGWDCHLPHYRQVCIDVQLIGHTTCYTLESSHSLSRKACPPASLLQKRTLRLRGSRDLFAKVWHHSFTITRE